jgi:type IV secretion system protein VirB4
VEPDETRRQINLSSSWVTQCARQVRRALDIAVENSEIIKTVRRVFPAADKTTRRISAILQHVGLSAVSERLAKWCRTSARTGSNAWVLDNARDTTDFSGSCHLWFRLQNFR